MDPVTARARSVGLFGALLLAWGFNYLFVRAGLAYAAPLALAAGRAALGAAVVAVFLLLSPAHRGLLDSRGKRDALLLGLPNTAFFFGLWFVAAGQVLPGTAAMVIYTFPLWVALFAYPVLGHRLDRVALGAVVVGFAGVVLITEPWAAQGTAIPALAVVELLGGAVAWALGTVYFQRRFRGAEMLEANFYQLLGGSATLVVAALIAGQGILDASWTLVGILLWLGAIGTGVAYTIWFSLLSRMRAATLGAYVFLVPLVALAASALLLGERLDAVQAGGVAAVLVSIYGTGRRSRPLEEPAG